MTIAKENRNNKFQQIQDIFLNCTPGGLSYCQWRVCSTANSTQLMSQLVAKIRFNGPITVADYMNEALTHASEVFTFILRLHINSLF